MNCLGLKTIIMYKPWWQITGIQQGWNVQNEGAKKPGGKQARGKSARHRGRTSQGAEEPGGESTRGEKAKGRTSQGRKSQGRTSQGANRQRGERAKPLVNHARVTTPFHQLKNLAHFYLLKVSAKFTAYPVQTGQHKYCSIFDIIYTFISSTRSKSRFN